MSLFMDSIQAFFFIQNQQGWREAFKLAAQFFRTPFFEFHRGFVLRKSLAEPIQVPPPSVEVDFAQVTRDDLSLLETIVPPLRVKRIAKKLQAGEICNVAIQEKRVVAYVLAGFDNTPSTREARLKLRPKEAYLWSGYALPEFRRKGVVRAVNLDLCRLLQKKGYKNVVLLVDRQNTASLGHCDKMGYRVTEKIMHLRILKWGFSRWAPIETPGTSQAVRRV